MKFLLSVIRHLGWKLSDYTVCWFYVKKLHIWTYDQQRFSSDLWRRLALKVEMLLPMLLILL